MFTPVRIVPGADGNLAYAEDDSLPALAIRSVRPPQLADMMEVPSMNVGPKAKTHHETPPQPQLRDVTL